MIPYALPNVMQIFVATATMNGRVSPDDTGESLSEALNFVSTIPRYDNRLFIKLRVLNV